MSRASRLLGPLFLLVSVALVAPPVAASLPPCDGTFHAVDTPVPSGDSALYSIDGASADDLWAVGIADELSPNALILRWNGTDWARYPVGGPLDDGDEHADLGAVDARTGSDAWAVGETFGGIFIHGFAAHWDGTTWRKANETGGRVDQNLVAVAAVGP